MPRIGETIRENYKAKKAAIKEKANPTVKDILELLEELERRVEILENMAL